MILLIHLLHFVADGLITLWLLFHALFSNFLIIKAIYQYFHQ